MATSGYRLISIRPMRREDVEAVAELERAIFARPWSVRAFFDELGERNRVYLVAERGERLVGYGGLLVVDEEGHITTLAVEPELQGSHLGSRLLLELIEAALRAGARHLALEVRASNRTAQRLYRKFGFAPIGVRKNYYRDEDALVMWAEEVDRPEYRERLEKIRGSLP
ncbi:MAG: ribosomal protein S18-alanine N-acetyltransferase [Actinomycetota bacterium]|nr:ribosomal protein S18-alanine N-acetyltransferase [Actinomycetota bacterium]